MKFRENPLHIFSLSILFSPYCTCRQGAGDFWFTLFNAVCGACGDLFFKIIVRRHSFLLLFLRRLRRAHFSKVLLGASGACCCFSSAPAASSFPKMVCGACGGLFSILMFGASGAALLHAVFCACGALLFKKISAPAAGCFPE